MTVATAVEVDVGGAIETAAEVDRLTGGGRGVVGGTIEEVL